MFKSQESSWLIVFGINGIKHGSRYYRTQQFTALDVLYDEPPAKPPKLNINIALKAP
ncbi:MAG: hypothetical protein OXF48_07650 [Bacteroidetes bacterium]|nr:hypothetical protein [Bacteroidota bacterium]